MADAVKHKVGTASSWSSNNPTLLEGQLGFESDVGGGMKRGDGSTSWNSLDYHRQPENVIDEGTSTSYTLVDENLNAYTRITDSSSVAVTIPTEATLGYSVIRGTVIKVRAAGAGGVTWTTTGLTINGTLSSLSQHEVAELVNVGTDEWDVV